jgi:dissimilatory sulfite reductase (desulfoviridin) alpha/beta subunit
MAEGLLFTSRQIPIIPFIHIKHVSDVKRELAEVDMELDRCGARVRNLNVAMRIRSAPRLSSIAFPCEKLEKFFGSQLMHKVKIGVVGCSAIAATFAL